MLNYKIFHILLENSPINKEFDSSKVVSTEWACLPIELLSRIFCLITATESKGVRYILRCGRVCKHWLGVSRNPASYYDVDLAFVGPDLKENKGQTLLKKLCKNRLQNVRKLSLSGWCKLNDEGLQYVVKHCSQLEMLDISSCQKNMSKIKPNTIIELSEKCTELRDLNVANLRFNSYANTWDQFLGIRGQSLTNLNFSGNVAFSNATFKAITGNCPQLKVLDCSNTALRSLSVFKFQNACPLLEELYLANVCIEVKDRPKDIEKCPGFANLRLASFATQDFNYWVTDPTLCSFLKNSSNLKTLDVRGAESLRELEVATQCVDSLERLYISGVPINTDIVAAISERWSKSLWDLDISKVTLAHLLFEGDALGTELCSNLLHLDVSHTHINSDDVLYVLEKFTSLESLDLSGCRHMVRGFKRRYSGRIELDKLSVDLKKSLSD